MNLRIRQAITAPWGWGFFKSKSTARFAGSRTPNVVHFNRPGGGGSVDLSVQDNFLTVSAQRDWLPEDGSRSGSRNVAGVLRPPGAVRRWPR